MATPSFTLSNVMLPGGKDPLGIWDALQTSAVSFSAKSTASSEPTWHIELPESTADAQGLLTDKAQAIELVHQDLAHVDRELARLSPTVPSFGPADEFSEQKNELLVAVDELREPVSFGLPKGVQDQESYHQWMTLVEQVRQMIAHYARIETSIAGTNVGVTTVGWTGDFTTTWKFQATAEAMTMHLQSVHTVLGSRVALIRLVSVIATGAAGLAVKAAIPGGQVLLLPAAWKFVRDVLTELRQERGAGGI